MCCTYICTKSNLSATERGGASKANSAGAETIPSPYTQEPGETEDEDGPDRLQLPQQIRVSQGRREFDGLTDTSDTPLAARVGGARAGWTGYGNGGGGIKVKDG